MNKSLGSPGEDASRRLRLACLQDPFLKEFETTLLQDPAGVQSLGKIKHVRDTLLELQPSGEKVIELMDHQRNAFLVLKGVAASVTTEAESWKTGVLALQKAHAEEEKAKTKAEEKAQKDEERKQAQAEKQAQRQEKRKREKEAARAKAAEGEGNGAAEEDAEGGGPDSKRSRRRTGQAEKELDETDPSVLRNLRLSQHVKPTVVVDDIKEFVFQVCSQPQVAAVLRFKKGMVKKVLTATGLASEVQVGWLN